MDPITGAIIAALAAGVVTGATEIGKKLLVDTYDALKAALKKKFGEDSDLVEAVDKLEQKRDSAGWKEEVEKQVQATKSNQDPELAKLAQALLDALKATDEGQQAIAKYNIQNSQIGVAGDHAHVEGGIHFGPTTNITQKAGDHATQIGTARDITINK